MNKFIIPGILILIGAVLIIVAGVVGFAVFPDIIDDKIIEQTQFGHEKTLDKWANVTVPITISYYIWHVKNPKDFLNGADAIPELEEIGPFVYEEKRRKINLNNTKRYDQPLIEYDEEIKYFFREDLSVGPITTLVNVVDIAYLSLAHGLYAYVKAGAPFPPEPTVRFFLEALNENKNGSIIIENIEVGDLLFHGYDIQNHLGPIWDALEIFMQIPEFEDRKFALFRFHNTTYNKFTVNTGIESHKYFGNLYSWRGEEELSFWGNNPSCNAINGSDGSVFPPFVEKDRKIHIFSYDLCRSIELTYDSEIKYKGIKGYRFAISKNTLESGKENPSNKCFCIQEETEDDEDLDNCPDSGVFMLRSCRSAAPVVISMPHFYGASNSHRENMEEFLKPVKSAHETSVDLEINSGSLLQALKRIQVNVDLDHLPYAPFNNIHRYNFPLLWFSEHVRLSDDQVEDLKDDLLKPIKIVDIVKWTVMGVGIVAFIAGLLFLFMRARS